MKLTEAKLKALILEMMEPLDPEMKANLLQLLNGEVEDQRQGVDLADMLVPDLIDQVDAMPQMALFSEPPSAESFLNIIRTRIQEKVAQRQKIPHPGSSQQYVDNLRANEETIKKLVADDSPLWTTTILDGWASDYHKKTIPNILNDIEYEGDGHDIWLASVAIDVVVKEFEKIEEDIAFDLELKWAFEIVPELHAYFKNYEDMLVSVKAKELSKLIRKTHNET